MRTNHRVVLDTNILISAILFGGKPRLILDEVIAERIDCILSSEILDELNKNLQEVIALLLEDGMPELETEAS